MVRAFRLVVFAQPFTEMVGLHPHNGIALLIEVGRAAKSLYRDVIFLDLFTGAFEISGADIRQNVGEVWRPIENAGRQNGVQLILLMAKLRSRVHGQIPDVVEAVYTGEKRLSTLLSRHKLRYI